MRRYFSLARFKGVRVMCPVCGHGLWGNDGCTTSVKCPGCQKIIRIDHGTVVGWN